MPIDLVTEGRSDLAGEGIPVEVGHPRAFVVGEASFDLHGFHSTIYIIYTTFVQNSRVVRIGLGSAASVLALALIAGVVFVLGNDYRFQQTSVRIPVPGGHLQAVLTTPRHGESRGLVVMIHGDGPVEATQDGLYAPWFEGAADAGFATLSWSKPGVAGSSGNWLKQSMDDRAAEVNAAIDWARSQPGLPTQRIVLWGASQAGWVSPKVVAERHDISGVVAVGTAINWLSQGRFNLLAELDHEHATAEQRRDEIARSDALNTLVEHGASYAEYRATTTETTPMTPDRWDFVVRNARADATADLHAAAERDLPILLLAGLHDRNVDMAQTQQVYQQVFGSHLSVRRVDSVHSMARPIVDDNATIGTAVGILWPRALLADGVIDAYREFLRALR